MKFDKLFNLVHSLDSSQKNIVTQYINGKKKTLTTELYRRILKYKSSDKATEAKVRARDFVDSGMFSIYRKKLAKLVIESLVSSEHAPYPTPPFVRCAFAYGAPEIAEETLFNEMNQLQKEEDWSKLRWIYDFVEELRVLDGHKIVVPSTIITVEAVETQIDDRRALFQIIEEIRTNASKPVEIKISLAERISRTLNSNYHGIVNQTLALKVRVNLAFLKGDFKTIFDLGENLLADLKAFPGKFPASMVAKEYRFLAMNAAAQNERSKAIKYSMELSVILGDSPHELLEIMKSKLMVGAVVAPSFAEESVANDCLQLLDENLAIFSDKVNCSLYYNLGMAYFYNENFKKAADCFQMSRNLNPRNSEYLQWEPQIALAISRYETGNLEVADSLIRSAIRKVRHSNLKYPQTAIQVAQEYCLQHIPPSVEQLDKVNRLMDDSEERSASQNFPIMIWIQSKVHSSPMKDVLLGSKSKSRALRPFADLG